MEVSAIVKRLVKEYRFTPDQVMGMSLKLIKFYLDQLDETDG